MLEIGVREYLNIVVTNKVLDSRLKRFEKNCYNNIMYYSVIRAIPATMENSGIIRLSVVTYIDAILQMEYNKATRPDGFLAKF